jgi:putative heme transporter
MPNDPGGLFATPRWLRSLGVTSWLAVGLTLLVIGAVWLMALTKTIVTPLITAAVIAAVASPAIAWAARHRVSRGIAAAVFLVLGLVFAAAVVAIVLGGVTGETNNLRPHLSEAKERIAGWATDLGINADTAQQATKDTSAGVSDAVHALLNGLVGGLEALSSLAIFLSFTALSLFFLLKDGPMIRRWAERHSGVPAPLARGVSQRILESFRGYFLGVTIVAVFNAVVVGIGAVLLGVPLAGTIAAITFLGAYVPYLGAWGAGAFSVLIALGGAGTDAAIGMAVIQLLGNGILQQLVQPIAYGSALGIHPLAVLVVTIAGGALFGAVGLILGAPLTAAATHIAEDLRQGREAEAEASADARPPEPAPAT